MKSFEMIAESGTYHQLTAIQPYREKLWAAAFEVETLDGMFDMLSAAKAIPIFDAAIDRFNTHSDELRLLLDSADHLMMRGNRAALANIRKWLAINGGTITGASEGDDRDELPPSP
ncbi:hypothetical protein [Nocardia africana]